MINKYFTVYSVYCKIKLAISTRDAQYKSIYAIVIKLLLENKLVQKGEIFYNTLVILHCSAVS